MNFLKEIIKDMPWWYWLLTVIFTSFYIFRGIVELKAVYKYNRYYLPPQTTTYERFIISYIQDILLKSIVTISGFIAFYIFVCISPPINEIKNIDIGGALLLIFLFAWGITGLCGYLPLYIARGKIPGT